MRFLLFIFSLLLVTTMAFSVDKTFKAPSGNLILDASGGVTAKKTLSLNIPTLADEGILIYNANSTETFHIGHDAEGDAHLLMRNNGTSTKVSLDVDGYSYFSGGGLAVGSSTFKQTGTRQSITLSGESGSSLYLRDDTDSKSFVLDATDTAIVIGYDDNDDGDLADTNEDLLTYREDKDEATNSWPMEELRTFHIRDTYTFICPNTESHCKYAKFVLPNAGSCIIDIVIGGIYESGVGYGITAMQYVIGRGNAALSQAGTISVNQIFKHYWGYDQHNSTNLVNWDTVEFLTQKASGANVKKNASIKATCLGFGGTGDFQRSTSIGNHYFQRLNDN